MKENVFKRRPYTQSKLKESIIERAVQSFGDLLQQCVEVNGRQRPNIIFKT